MTVYNIYAATNTEDDDLDDLLDEFNIKENADGTIDTGITYLDLDKFRVVVHHNVLDTMNRLYNKYPNLEYGLYLKGFFDPSQNIFFVDAEDLDEDIYIPKQEVSSATINFTEGRPSAEFNTAIHKHPKGALGFSGTDEVSINANFECSLLYTKEEGIFLANINVFTDMQGVAFKFKTKRIHIFYPETETIRAASSKIKPHNRGLSTSKMPNRRLPSSLGKTNKNGLLERKKELTRKRKDTSTDMNNLCQEIEQP